MTQGGRAERNVQKPKDQANKMKILCYCLFWGRGDVGQGNMKMRK